MPGALIHIAVGLVSAVIVYFIMHKLEFSLAIFIGNLLPDVLKIAYLAIYYQSLDVKYLVATNMHLPIHLVVEGWEFLLFFFSFFFALAWLIYHFHFIKKKKLREWDELIFYLAIGYFTHTVMDFLFPISHTGGTRIWI